MTTTTPIYNGKTIRQLLSNLPKGMIKQHKREYINNCIQVSKADNEQIRYRNFIIINYYLTA